MNKRNQKLLKALLHNSRRTTTRLAKEAGLSRENATYAIKKLQEKGVINGFVTRIDHERLGFQHHVMYVEYAQITPEIEKQLFEFLQQDPNSTWIGTATGRWSLIFDLYVKNQKELDEFLERLLMKFPKAIGEYQVHFVRASNYYFAKLIGERNTPEYTATDAGIDYTDKQILKILNSNARATYVDLGQRLDLTANAIKHRIKQLEKEGIVKGYGVSLNHTKLGWDWHGTQLKLITTDPDKKRKLIEFLRQHPRCIFIYEYSRTGTVDLDAGFITQQSSELRDTINQLRREFYDSIRIQDTFLVLEQFSTHGLPEAVFE